MYLQLRILSSEETCDNSLKDDVTACEWAINFQAFLVLPIIYAIYAVIDKIFSHRGKDLKIYRSHASSGSSV